MITLPSLVTNIMGTPEREGDRRRERESVCVSVSVRVRHPLSFASVLYPRFCESLCQISVFAAKQKFVFVLVKKTAKNKTQEASNSFPRFASPRLASPLFVSPLPSRQRTQVYCTSLFAFANSLPPSPFPLFPLSPSLPLSPSFADLPLRSPCFLKQQCNA